MSGRRQEGSEQKKKRGRTAAERCIKRDIRGCQVRDSWRRGEGSGQVREGGTEGERQGEREEGGRGEGRIMAAAKNGKGGR